MSADEDELVAEISGVLQELVDDGHLELASRRGTVALAAPLLAMLERDTEANIGDWLLDRNEVTELYLEPEELRERFRRVIARMTNEEAPPKHHPELAAAIASAPDDPQAWAVYADWLHEQDDPRGELMAVQLQREERKDDDRLERQEAALLARHRRHFFGDLPIDETAEDRALVTLRRGFFSAATVSDHHDLRTLLALESSRFLQQLTVPCRSLDPLEELLSSAALPRTLVRLQLGKRHPYQEASAGGRLDVGRATRGLGRLEHIVVRGGEVVLAELETPRLRELIIEAHKVRIVGDASLASLASLEQLEIDASEIEGVDALSAVFAQPPPKLNVLAIRNVETSDVGRALLEALLRSPLARALRALDLRKNSLGDQCGALIVAQREVLEQLESLRFERNSLSRALREQIEGLWPSKSEWFSGSDDDDDDDHDEDEDNEDEDEDDDERYDDSSE